jgi:putative membrane protein
MWHGMGGFGWGIGGMFLMAVFWLAIAAALVWIVRAVWGRAATRERQGRAPESALEILQRRYARGEIERAEFEEKRRDLS